MTREEFRELLFESLDLELEIVNVYSSPVLQISLVLKKDHPENEDAIISRVEFCLDDLKGCSE